MKRVTRKNKGCIVGYHVQEFRCNSDALDLPINCTDPEAWLGEGYYFWVELSYAKFWGVDKKMSTGGYDVYHAHIEEENLLNTVFSEAGYNLFFNSIEDAIAHLKSKSTKEVTLEKVHAYLMDKIWPKLSTPITGIIYDDLPKNNDMGRIHSIIKPLFYKKRIQIVAFNTNIIHNFELLLEDQSKPY